MRRAVLAASVTLCLVAGCGPAPSPTVTASLPPVEPGATATTTPGPAPTGTAPSSPPVPGLLEVGPGIWACERVDLLPLPTSGYTLYLVGEFHGEAEAHLLLLDYVKRLHEAVGLRDLALELSPRYEQALNDYVLGRRDSLPDAAYWDAAGMDIPDGVRALNASLPAGEKIRLHLVDLDYTTPMIHAHLEAIEEQADAPADLVPSLPEFEQMDEAAVLDVINRLAGMVDGGLLTNELTQLRDSVRYRFTMVEAGSWDRAADELLDIREAAVAREMQHLQAELEGSPIVALYGSWHVQKRLGMHAVRGEGYTDFVEITVSSWAQRLAEAGVAVHSLYVHGLSGSAYVRGRIVPIDLDPAQFHFPAGATLADALALAPAHHILYIDLRVGENAAAWFGEHFDPHSLFNPEILAGEAYDGIVLFREVTPLMP